MARSKSSNRWMQEHFDDEYVRMAQAQGYRSRAVFKLSEIQDKDQLIKPGMNIVDLGAAPGGWSQLARQLLAKKINWWHWTYCLWSLWMVSILSKATFAKRRC